MVSMGKHNSSSGGKPGILWSGVVRNRTILVEASVQGTGHRNDRIAEAARRILRKQETPGWEHATLRVGLLTPLQQQQTTFKATKFHVYDHREGEAPLVWVIACVYDPSLIEAHKVQSFISKMVTITEVFRDNDPLWRQGPTLAAQHSFAPILLQRMEEVSYLGKTAILQDQVEDLKEIMSRNIEAIMERGETIDDLKEDATRLKSMASVFQKNSKTLKRRMLLQNAKHGLLLGTAITAGVAVLVVPLVAVL